MASRNSYKKTTPAATPAEPAEEASPSPEIAWWQKFILSTETQLRILAPIAIVLSIISISTGVYFASQIQSDLAQIDADVLERLGDELSLQQDQQNELQAQLQRYQQTTQQSLQQIQQGTGDDPSSQIKQIIKVLEAQQEDYRGFLRILRQGMIEVSQMTRGTREWTNNYVNQMGTVNQKSLQRTQELKKISPDVAGKP